LAGISATVTAMYQYFAPRRRRAVETTLQQAQPRKKKQIGRNDPCYCGSGKKYKKCCGSIKVNWIVYPMANPLIEGKAGLLEEGYGIIPGVFGERAIAALTSALGKESHRRSKAGIRHLMSVPEVAEIASIKEMVSLAKEVLGESAAPFRATLFDKSSVANWLVAWHQDTALPIRERREVSGWGPWSVKEGVVYAHAPKEALERVVALRLHLDDSDLDNGPLRVLPGTQKLGLLTDEEIHRLAESIKPIDCPVAAGGVIVMRPLIIHASSEVASNRPRRVLHVEYAESTRICAELELAAAWKEDDSL
jgi:hypothetical protein